MTSWYAVRERQGFLRLRVVGECEVLVLLVLLDDVLGGDRTVRDTVAVLVLLRGGDQLGQHPGECVHLVAAQLGPRGEAWWFLVEDALEPEHEGEADFPLRRRALVARLHLRERGVERVAEGRSGREHDRRVLVGTQEGLAGPG